MTESISFKLPVCPSANNLFVNAKGRGRVRSKRYRAWSDQAKLAMRITENNTLRTWSTLTERVVVEIYVGPVRGDVANREKALCDLLTEMQVISDDRLIDDIRIRRIDTMDPKYCTISVRPLRGEAA